MHIHLLQLGRIPYAEGLRLQAEVVAARKAATIGDTFILLEHPPKQKPARRQGPDALVVN